MTVYNTTKAVFSAPIPAGIPKNPREGLSLLLSTPVQTQKATSWRFLGPAPIPGITQRKERSLNINIPAIYLPAHASPHQYDITATDITRSVSSHTNNMMPQHNTATSICRDINISHHISTSSHITSTWCDITHRWRGRRAVCWRLPAPARWPGPACRCPESRSGTELPRNGAERSVIHRNVGVS